MVMVISFVFYKNRECLDHLLKSFLVIPNSNLYNCKVTHNRRVLVCTGRGRDANAFFLTLI